MENGLEQQVLAKAQKWLDGNYDAETKKQVKYLMDNDMKELVESFYKDLEFGTGGLRGVMGVGTNRMNIYTVGAATQGLSNYLKNLARAICQEPQVIVLDEPTAFLDIRHKLELLYLLKNMVREKKVAVLMSLHELDLAQKISDHIICVKGDNSIGRFGTPEEIFSGDYIKELFQIEKGTYLTDYGSVELEAVKGEPKVFVIGGNGTGIPVYRQLQKEGIPFAAGILWENDREYPVAEALASVVIREKAFESVSDATFETAVKVLKNCEKVICCMENFGTYQEPCRQLWKIAKDLGKI